MSIDTLSVRQLPICSSSSRANPIDSMRRTFLQSYQSWHSNHSQIIHKSFTNHSQFMHKSFTNHSQIIHKSFTNPKVLTRDIEIIEPTMNTLFTLQYHANLISSNRSQPLNPTNVTTFRSSFCPVPWPVVTYNWGENQHVSFQIRNLSIALQHIVGHRITTVEQQYGTSSSCKVRLSGMTNERDQHPSWLFQNSLAGSITWLIEVMGDWIPINQPVYMKYKWITEGF